MCSLHDQQRPRGEQQHRDEHRVLSNSEQTECSGQYYKVLLSEYRFSLLQTLKRAREFFCEQVTIAPENKSVLLLLGEQKFPA